MLFFIVLCSTSPKASADAARSALNLCYFAIIPSLFPFFVFSKILIKADFCSILKKYTAFIFRPLFNVNGSGSLAFIIGILSGYPAGAYVVCELYTKGIITKNEAHRLLPFCNNSGPLFIIGTVGAVMLKNAKTGIFLYAIHIISALLVGLCFRFYKKNEANLTWSKTSKETKEISHFGKIFTDSVSASVLSVLTICGFIVVSSCLFSVISPFLDIVFKNSATCAIFKGIFEITLGINDLSGIALDKGHSLILISALLGFGGICVFFQVTGALALTDLSAKTYFWGKIMQSAFSSLICYFSLKSGAISAFSQNASTFSFVPQIPLYLPTLLIFAIFFALCFKKRKLF